MTRSGPDNCRVVRATPPDCGSVPSCRPVAFPGHRARHRRDRPGRGRRVVSPPPSASPPSSHHGVISFGELPITSVLIWVTSEPPKMPPPLVEAELKVTMENLSVTDPLLTNRPPPWPAPAVPLVPVEPMPPVPPWAVFLP